MLGRLAVPKIIYVRPVGSPENTSNIGENYRAKTSLTNFPECFPHLFLSHFEPKTSHNARFWGPNTLVF